MRYKGNREKHSPDAFEGVAKSLLLHEGLGGLEGGGGVRLPLRRLLTNTVIRPQSAQTAAILKAAHKHQFCTFQT